MLSSAVSNTVTQKAPDNNLSIIIRAICFFWFIARVKSRKIWMLQDRLYPSIPVFDFLEGFPPIILESLYYITMLCLLFLVFKPQQTIVQIVLFASVFIAAIFEMTAWQPWEYQYLCMIGVIILNRRNPAALYSMLILIVSCTYFYTGLQKFNGGFLHSVWKGMILKKFFGIEGVNSFVHYSGLALAVFEALAGLALIVVKNKKVPAYLLIAMHIFILVLLLSVVGVTVVIPWNITMILVIHLIFIRNEFIERPKFFFIKRNIIIFLLWAVMPAASFFGYWEQHFSSSMFSGKQDRVIICFDTVSFKYNKQSTNSLKLRNVAYDCQQHISIHKWCVAEMAVLPPTSDFYFTKFKEKFSKQNPDLSSRFYISYYPFKKLYPLK